jgi:isochorismate pyruvate lyase
MELCKSLDEVRENINRIDRRLVSLIAERSAYVKQAALFKKDAADVQAPKRVEAVIGKVRKLAGENGVDPGIVEAVYRKMIQCFTASELDEWKSRNG